MFQIIQPCDESLLLRVSSRNIVQVYFSIFDQVHVEKSFVYLVGSDQRIVIASGYVYIHFWALDELV